MAGNTPVVRQISSSKGAWRECSQLEPHPSWMAFLVLCTGVPCAHVCCGDSRELEVSCQRVLGVRTLQQQTPPPPNFLHSAVFFSLQSLCPTHTGKPTGVAVSHCITRFQTQLILTTCQIRYHSHLWDHRSTGQL